MNYIVKHWRGEQSLKWSFWINFCALTIVFRALTFPLLNNILTLNVYLMMCFFCFSSIITVWLVVGVWRASNHHIQQTSKKTWGRLAKVVMVVHLFNSIPNFVVAIIPPLVVLTDNEALGYIIMAIMDKLSPFFGLFPV